MQCMHKEFSQNVVYKRRLEWSTHSCCCRGKNGRIPLGLTQSLLHSEKLSRKMMFQKYHIIKSSIIERNTKKNIEEQL